jgi:phospholipase/lecithinase/hemolysin
VTKVVVVNVPDVTTTPRFAAILAQVEATSGTAKRDATQAIARSWLLAYNTALAQGLAGTNVQLFDLYAEGTRVTNNPAQYNLTNVTTPACPKVAGGTDSLGTATLNLPATVAACNTANLSANIPVGETSANWWQSYGYADNFHPTPALHKLIGQAINIQLAKAGWL